jgi:hypothetical protein
MKGLKTYQTQIAFSGIALFWVFSFFYYQHWHQPAKLFQHDVAEYYVYLPASIIYNDHSYGFLDSLENPKFKERTSIYTSETGKKISKMSPGMAVMYSPFFFIAHISALLGRSAASGYSKIYAFWIAFSGLFYGYLGLLVLFRILIRLFDKNSAIWTVLAIGLGTNLLYYSSSESAMSHAAGFFLMSCGIYQMIKWFEKKNQINGILLGLVLGLIVLVRPVNIFFALLPILYQIRTKDHFFARLIKRPTAMIGLILSGLVVVSLQLFLWKWKTGHWLYFSYQGEGFDFANPHWWKSLFGFRKGWLIYTPIMTISLLGLFVKNKGLKPFVPAIPIILILMIYVLSSWWCWWYGGSFGFRPMIEWYALLAIPFAAFVQQMKGMREKLLAVFVGLFILLNVFQTHQYNYQTIHWDSMSWSAYKKVFLKRLPPKNFEQYLDHPDYTRPGLD